MPLRRPAPGMPGSEGTTIRLVRDMSGTLDIGLTRHSQVRIGLRRGITDIGITAVTGTGIRPLAHAPVS